MKAIKFIILALFISFSFVAIAKDDEAKENKLTMNYAVQVYIDAVTQGKLKDFGDILDNQMKFTVTQGEKIVSFSKREMLEAMKATENIQQNCKTDYSVVEQNDSQSIIKVTMAYDDFTKLSYVTIGNTNKGWKITNVSSVFR